MRLKQNIVMFVILFLLLSSICVGIKVRNNINESIQKEPTDEIIDDVIPTTFVGSINDKYNVPKEIMDVIVNYMDDYFESVYTLEKQDTTEYFVNDIDGKVSDYAIKLTIEARKLYDTDLTMSDAHYDLKITDYFSSNGKYYVDFLEDDYFYFKFLNGISSETYDVENSMVIEKIDDEYKISEYEKVQGYYMMFNDNKDENLDEVYKLYFDCFIDEKNNRQLSLDKSFSSDKTYDVKYDRNAATKYASTYYHMRNDEYYDFEDEGGNCQNFASQSLLAGGMIMDENGEYNWYFNDYSDYDSSFVHVGSFEEYCMENEGRGLVCELPSNVFYAEPGDIVQVGVKSVSHTTIVSRIVDGHILLNSNSIDMKDFPLEAYTYPTKKLIKIIGSNY